MTKTARAAVYEAPNEPFVIKEYPLRAAGPGEALVRITMSTICRSDIHSYQGHRPNPCPGILGHEIVGVIEELGAGVERDLRGDALKTGDRVTWTEYFHDGPSPETDLLDMPQKAGGVRKYGHDRADIDPHFLGGFAEYCYIQPGTGILKLPDVLTDAEATPLNCGVATMMAVTEAAGIGMGDVVAVQGLGLLGLYGAAIAKARGAAKVIALDTVPDRLARARDFGADEVVDISGLNADLQADAVSAVAGRGGADAVIEVCGHPAAVAAGLGMLRTGGRYVIAGLVNPGAMVEVDGNLILRKCLTIEGVHNYHPRHLVQALDFVVANKDRYPFDALVDGRFGLDELDEAFAQAAGRQVLRAAILP